MTDPDPEREARVPLDVQVPLWDAINTWARAIYGCDPSPTASHGNTAAMVAVVEVHRVIAAALHGAADRATQAEQECARLKRYHEPGCPVIADDESDAVLGDYQECVCATKYGQEWEEKAAHAEREQTRMIHERNAMMGERDEARAREAQLRAALEYIKKDPEGPDAWCAVYTALGAATPDEALRVVREVMAAAEQYRTDTYIGEPESAEQRLNDALAAAARLFGPTTSR